MTLCFIYRLAMIALLIYGGTTFLVYTIQIEDLVLNAVALELIRNLDDLLFGALATAEVRHLISRLEGLPMKSLPAKAGIDMTAGF